MFAFQPQQRHREINSDRVQPQAALHDERASFIKLREQQVNEMNAGKVVPKASSKIEWPAASDQAVRLWTSRHPSFMNYTTHYMASQRRILFLSDVAPTKRFEAFEQICYQRTLAPTTAMTYWTTWLGVQKALGITPCEADPRTTKVMKARATAYPVQFPTPASLADMELLVQTYRDALPSLAAIAMMAFILGQRISDMIQLAVHDIQPNKNELMITVRRGKTMSVSTPYTLWLNRSQYPTETIIEVAIQAKREGRLFLLSEFNSDEERSQVGETIRDMLTSINEQLELRSIRRGGLQRMAGQGIPLTTVIQFSRHADEKMLMRYLSWGAHAADRQQSMLQAVNLVTKDMSTTDRTQTTVLIQ